MICSALVCIVAQRMVRRICPECAQIATAPLAEQMAYSKEIGEKQSEFLFGSGCKSCASTGYKGRLGIFEVLSISDDIRMMLLNGTTTVQLRNQAIEDGMIPLMRDGMLKVKAGVTTPAEVLRNAYSTD